ncbi:MAG: [protein-PII] uridylyltransferase [Myxococcales bacterium]|nr:[protein-PII] uridylyltransferase [Myxococcales bacterium]
MSSSGTLRDLVRLHEDELRSAAASGTDGLGLAQAHARWMDGLLQGQAARIIGDGPTLPAYVLAGVGSYGRGALAPRSDVDLRLVMSADAAEAAQAWLERLLYPLWDAKLSVGHQVLTASEMLSLAHDDLASATTLLDLRFVAGDETVLAQLLDRAHEGVFEAGSIERFIDRLEAEIAGRHERFGGSVYLLEPDTKSGAGAMRDLDAIRWVARARYRVSDGEHGFLRELLRLGVLVSREAQELEAATAFMWRVKNRLHLRGQRRSDRLTFDAQEAIAIAMDYAPRSGDGAESAERGAPDSQRDARTRAAAAERLMQDFYVHARAITRLRERIFERAKPPRRRPRPVETDLGGGVRLFDGHVTVAGSRELQEEPALALRLYDACVQKRAPVLAFARDAVARAATDPAWCEALRASPEAAKLFVDIVCTIGEVPTRRGSIVGELHDVGLLLAMIPEFLPVTGRVHHDVYHVYTVDVHSVAAIDCLRALARGELAHMHPLASRLAAELADAPVLFLATLLHDVGKGYPDAEGSRKNHSQSGADLVRKILPRFGWTLEIDEVAALVASHLSMYHVATRRDLDDESTVEEFCRGVRGREGLRALYLLTIADITTTSPTAMTTWKAKMLENLYVAADAYLSGQRAPGYDDERRLRILAAAAQSPRGVGMTPDVIERFVQSMPERYPFTTAPESLAAHAAAVANRGARAASVELVGPAHGDAVELCVVAEDRPGLLAGIAAALVCARLEVLAAQIHSRTRAEGSLRASECSEAVDVFWVRPRSSGAGEVADLLPRLQRDLEDVASGRVEPESLLRARTGSSSPWGERRGPAVATEIVIDERASPRHTVIEVFARDRPGLLYSLARALHELSLSIAVSKINTEGTRVADVFYVSEIDGTKAVDQARLREIRERLTLAAEG